MADTGFNWGAWADLQVSAVDVDDTALADEATLTTDEVDLDGKAACEVAVKAIEDNTGACDGDLDVYLLREDGDGSYQTINDANLLMVVDPVQNTTRLGVASIDPGSVGSFKLLLDNDSGQELAVTVSMRTATIPAAS